VTASIERFDSAAALAEGVARVLIARLGRIQLLGRTPQLVLTGGTIARRLHAAVAAAPERERVQWDNVDFWWGDERYVPKADPERNAGQAIEAMIEHLPVAPARVHEMPASDGEYADDLDAAAVAYAADLLAHAPAEGPWFDILMLGVGPDGHCASLFPGRSEVLDPAPVLAVRKAPKPPPNRITLGMETLRRSREVWFVASGSEKAEAVASAVHGVDVLDVPAAGPMGTERTVWFVDADAAWML
jgi:6-phosphogluconolactonase